MRKQFPQLTFAALLTMFVFVACSEKNELTDQLYNPYEDGNGIELIQFDSIQKYGASPWTLKTWFHIDGNYVSDLSKVERVILYRNGIEKGRLSPGNFSYFVDITVLPGGIYDYQLSMIMKDSSYTKKTLPYQVIY